MIYLLALINYFNWSSPVNADPVTAFLVTSLGLSTTVAAIVTTILVNIGIAAVSALMYAKQTPTQTGGIVTERKTTGGTKSQSFQIGFYSTAGHEVTPPYSFDGPGDTPNEYLTLIISLGDLPGQKLRRLMINGEYVTLEPSDVNPQWGSAVMGKYEGDAYIKYYDGTQTTADSYLTTVFGEDPDRPWTTNHVGRGICYAIVTLKWNDELFSGEPTLRFEMEGIPLYDVRKDSTAGGSGPQRWGNKSTWVYTENPAVMIYNILRGIEFPTLAGKVDRWGGECSADDLPVASWAAAMNICDEQVPNKVGGTYNRYRAGYEIKVADMQPCDVIDELLKACSGAIVEVGGVYKMRAGGPGLPVAFLTDGDILVSKPSDFDPFPSMMVSKNTVYASYPSPAEMWNEKDAPVLQNATYLAEDQGFPIEVDLKLPTVPFHLQVQRQMREWLNDDRRWRRHNHSLLPQCFFLEPLDVVAWASDYNQYDNKLFEIDRVSENYQTLINAHAWREVDPNDWQWSSDYELPNTVAPGTWRLPRKQKVAGWGVMAWQQRNNAGVNKKPAIRCIWNGLAAVDARAMKIEVRNNVTNELVSMTAVTGVTEGEQIITEGINRNTTYKVRARYIMKRPKDWTDWEVVTTFNIKTQLEDLDDDIANAWQTALDGVVADAEKYGIKSYETFPATGSLNQIILKLPGLTLHRWNGSAWVADIATPIPDNYLTATKFAQGIEPITIVSTGSLPTTKSTSTIFFGGKVYRWNGSAYVASIPTADLTGTLSAGQFSQSLRPVEVVTTLPTTGNFNGRTVFLTTDGKLMRYNNGAFTAAVDGADIVANSITAGQIQAGAIGATQIASDAITARTLMVTDFTNFIPDSELTDLASWNTSGNVTIVAGSASWGYPRLMRLTGASDAYATGESKVFPVVPGEELHLAYSARRVSGAGGSAGFQIRFSALPDMSNYVASAVGSVQGTAIKRNTSSTVVPSGMFFARVVAVKNNNGPTEVLIGGMVVRRKMGGSLIVDGAISTDKLDANAVTADKIAANSISAGKVQAGAIGADQVAANALTSKHIAIGDFTNHASGSDFEDAALIPWQMPSSNNRNSSQKKTGSWSLQLTSVDTATANLLTPIDCAGGDEFYVSVQMLRGSAWNGTDGNSKIRFFNYNTGELIAGLPYGAAQMPSASTWYKKEIGVNVPAGCTKMGVQLVKDATAGALHLDDIEIRRKNGGNLIVDGAIVSSKIDTGAVTANAIFAGAVTTSKIASGSITAASGILADLVVTTSKIGDLQVSSLKIGDNAVTSPYFVEGANSFTFNEGIKTLLSIVVQKTANPVTVNFLGAFEGLFGIDYQGIELYLYRSSTAVGNSVVLHLDEAGRGTSCGYQFYDASTVTGTYTYSIRGRKRLNDGGGVNMTTGGMFVNQYRK